MDCGGEGRVATDIATYECSIYRVENEHDVVIEPRLQTGDQLDGANDNEETTCPVTAEDTGG